jgi:hypothetical protein
MNEFNASECAISTKQFYLVIQWQLQKELGRNHTGYPLQYANNKERKASSYIEMFLTMVNTYHSALID